jgi:hypothetical protein
MGNMFLHWTKPTENNREIRILGAKKGLELSPYSAFCIVEQGERPSLFSTVEARTCVPWLALKCDGSFQEVLQVVSLFAQGVG